MTDAFRTSLRLPNQQVNKENALGTEAGSRKARMGRAQSLEAPSTRRRTALGSNNGQQQQGPATGASKKATKGAKKGKGGSTGTSKVPRLKRRSPPNWEKIHQQEELRKQRQMAKNKKPSTQAKGFNLHGPSTRRTRRGASNTSSATDSAEPTVDLLHDEAGEADAFCADQSALQSILDETGVQAKAQPVKAHRATIAMGASRVRPARSEQHRQQQHTTDVQEASTIIQGLRERQRMSMYARGGQPSLGSSMPMAFLTPRANRTRSAAAPQPQPQQLQPAFAAATLPEPLPPSSSRRFTLGAGLFRGGAPQPRAVADPYGFPPSASAPLHTHQPQPQSLQPQQLASEFTDDGFVAHDNALQSILDDRGIDEALLPDAVIASKKQRASVHFGAMRVKPKSKKRPKATGGQRQDGNITPPQARTANPLGPQSSRRLSTYMPMTPSGSNGMALRFGSLLTATPRSVAPVNPLSANRALQRRNLYQESPMSARQTAYHPQQQDGAGAALGMAPPARLVFGDEPSAPDEALVKIEEMRRLELELEAELKAELARAAAEEAAVAAAAGPRSMGRPQARHQPTAFELRQADEHSASPDLTLGNGPMARHRPVAVAVAVAVPAAVAAPTAAAPAAPPAMIAPTPVKKPVVSRRTGAAQGAPAMQGNSNVLPIGNSSVFKPTTARAAAGEPVPAHCPGCEDEANEELMTIFFTAHRSASTEAVKRRFNNPLVGTLAAGPDADADDELALFAEPSEPHLFRPIAVSASARPALSAAPPAIGQRSAFAAVAAH